MKGLSIFGVVWHSLSLVCVIGFSDTDPLAAIGWGMFSALFGIGASVYYISQSKPKTDPIAEMVKLNKLKQALDSGAISQDVYNLKKMELSK